MNFAANLFIISAASGAGKSTMLRRLFAELSPVSPMKFSVSHTTRAMREGETNGVEYHFVTQERFREMIAENDFLEWAEVFGNYYGTSRSAVVESLSQGTDVFLDIDWQGARQIRKVFPGARSVFILPPGLDELRRRLEGRGQDSPEIIAGRMEKARGEIVHYDEYDYVIVNDDLDEACRQLKAVVTAERTRLSCQKIRQADLISRLLSGS